MKTFHLLALLASLSSLVVSQQGLTVHTQQGDVTGTISTPTVRQFLGIPYATAKRWEAPQLPPRRSEIFNATTFGASCPQDFTPANVEFLVLTKNQASNLNVTQSESDCLSINVWSPVVQRKQNTAVMVWIYGGSLLWGTSNISVYDGTNMVRDNEDVTVVSFNYRLNIFGQPNAPQLAGKNVSQNFALLDVDAAVKWVYDNIVNFGGDPNRITLFGQSAGAVAVDAYLFAHPNDTMVKGAIQQSGNVLAAQEFFSSQLIFDSTGWTAVADEVGCGNTSTSAQFSCMQAVPFEKLEDAVISTNGAFSPIADNITIFADFMDRGKAGNFLHIPVLSGHTAQEDDIFAVGQEILALGSAEPTITQLISDIQTQILFTCSTSVGSVNRVNAGLHTWRYHYQAIFPGISTRTDLRAYHSSEIPIVFGTYNLTTTSASPTQVELSKYVQKAWVAFAKDPVHGLLDFGWPIYDPNSMSVAQLGSIVNQTGVVFAQGAMLDASCSHVDSLTSISTQLSSLLSGTV